MENENMETVEENSEVVIEENNVENQASDTEEIPAIDAASPDTSGVPDIITDESIPVEEVPVEEIPTEEVLPVDENIQNEEVSADSPQDIPGDTATDVVMETQTSENVETVSENGVIADAGNSIATNNTETVSGNASSPTTINNIYLTSSNADETEALMEYTIFDKPFVDYTVSEGFLFLIFILTMLTFVWSLFKRYQ